MKDFLDRIPTQAGRRKITHADGTSEYVTVEMADEPSVEGTPLNRAAFMALQGFSNENTTISKSGNVTTVTITHEDGGKTITTITKNSSTLSTVVSKYTGPSGNVITKTTTIDNSSSVTRIGGVVS
jgi:hypothetical protein